MKSEFILKKGLLKGLYLLWVVLTLTQGSE
jgi:hypothetical protein